MTGSRWQLMTTGIVAAAALSVVLFSAQRGAAAQGDLIQGPPDWIPLTAEYTITEPDGIVTHFVESHATNGSNRRVGTGHPVGDQIYLTDMPARAFYQFMRGVWTKYPLRIQRNNGRPFMALRRTRVVEVPASDPRVQAVASTVGIPVTFFEFHGSDGMAVIFCPELNMLEVWTATKPANPSSGRLRETSRVTLGEPSVAYTPPTGITIEERKNPWGSGVAEALPSVLRETWSSPVPQQ